VSHFADELLRRSRSLGAPIAVGFDPRPGHLPPALRASAAASFRAQARAYETFAECVLQAAHGVAVAIKVQIAFFEALGLPGVRAYSRVLRMAREHGFLTIGDIKRADIGTSSEAYADAHWGPAATRAGSDADALTINGYLGIDGCRPFLDRCLPEGRGLFVLVRTSNPSAPDLQDLVADGRPVFMHMAEKVREWGAELVGAEGYSSVGAVVGATFPDELLQIRRAIPSVPFLVPGFGAQGGGADDVVGALDDRGAGLLISSSRGITCAHLDADPGLSATAAMRKAAEEMRDQIAAAFAQRGNAS